MAKIWSQTWFRCAFFLMVLVRKRQQLVSCLHDKRNFHLDFGITAILAVLSQGYISQALILHANADGRQSPSGAANLSPTCSLGFPAVAWSDKSLYRSVPSHVVCLPVALTQNTEWILENQSWKIRCSYSSFLLPDVSTTPALRWDLGGQVLSHTGLPLPSLRLEMLTLLLLSVRCEVLIDTGIKPKWM